MATVEIKLRPVEVSVRLDEIRRWLSAGGVKAAQFTSTGSRDEVVVSVEFGSSDDAAAFAREFARVLVGS